MVRGPWPKRTIFQLGIYGSCQLQEIVNVFHFEASAAEEATFITDDLAQQSSADLEADWKANLMTPWLAIHTTDYTVQRLTAQVLERPGNVGHKLAAHEEVLSSGNVGVFSGVADDMTTCIVIRWRTPQAGKSHRGRSYIGPLPEAESVSGRMFADPASGWHLFAAAMLTRYKVVTGTSGRWNLTVYSRPYNSGDYQYASRRTGSLTVITPPDYVGNSTNVTSYFVDPILRVQRKREIGVGR